jgi:hypothetical protein
MSHAPQHTPSSKPDRPDQMVRRSIACFAIVEAILLLFIVVHIWNRG